MAVEDQDTLPLPDDAALADAAAALNDAGYWGEVVDRQWRQVFMTDELRFSYGALLGRITRHLGDGIAAFFLAETAGSESAAARACIAAARELRSAMAGVATRSGLTEDDAVLRFGLHCGSTLYVGQIVSVGRSVLERLELGDAAALGIDTDNIAYVPVADLDTATEKARRDAPAIAVCAL